MALPVNSAVGAAVVMLRTPAMALLPNSVLCGPRSTSTRSTSTRSLNAAAWKPRGTSSMTTATSDSTAIPLEKVPMPRMLIAKLPGCEPYVITKLGDSLTTSPSSRTLLRSKVSAVSAVTATGTSCSFSARLVAVTVTTSSCKSLEESAGCSAASALRDAEPSAAATADAANKY